MQDGRKSSRNIDAENKINWLLYVQGKVRVPGYGAFNDMNFTHVVLLWIPVSGIS